MTTPDTSSPALRPLLDGIDALLPVLRPLYEDLHAHPELSMRETRTAGVVADRLRALPGCEVTEGVGGTGVVGVLRGGAGDGPTVLLRADMDGLPVLEATGLPYASRVRTTDRDGNDTAVMHACGHDMHVTCLLGAAELLATHRQSWRGTVVAVFQPAEETGEGASGMLADGFADRFPRPDVCLGQHVGPFPAGVAVTRPGAVMSASDSFRVRLFGRGGHGSSPESAVDPVVMAAAVVMRLQTVVSREVGAGQRAVVTVGSIHAGTKENIIPDEAELKINIRSVDPVVRQRVIDAVHRIVRAEAAASGAPKEPEFTSLGEFPVTENTADATSTVVDALRGALGEQGVFTLPQPINGSEDFGLFGTALGVPSVFWHFGGADPALFADMTPEELATRGLPPEIPTNHSPKYAPLQDPTIAVGVRALVAAAMAWVGAPASA
ncbi:amidohydrolase [Streptomyces beihaiensis]|uniref:Amidohydrolase n=1 Tax=Streptomyces beihaiensis TaxID=2984495 RepID=A0ABT3U0B4_9ACTN|nr:amidohydrolase [Streptomyces beihaiensis]MCX3062037.1 amidohydrolase [Streptomyces beihaiensis]